MIKRPYMNDKCESCIHEKESHCGAVIECSYHKEKLAPQERLLNHNISLTGQLLGIKFEGYTIGEKEAFCELYRERRESEERRLLNEMYDEFIS
ncbi:hypothetical protein H9649_07565 [Sporosarcina sp. Sa2YVA2]|uniref:Uncharacterized protein n=1 Tax=Sporosarcina quadrami TaxID=2762234 RepID=A0ABR8U8R9_9BACL|nr:hypothetical protein [Sporosarcina quadrami]MBD7984432.1 hypothetical protein [Sporosarcina quadrami]